MNIKFLCLVLLLGVLPSRAEPHKYGPDKIWCGWGGGGYMKKCPDYFHGIYIGGEVGD